MNEKYWIGFSSFDDGDSSFALTLYNHFGDIKSAFEASLKDLSKIEGINVKKAEKFISGRDDKKFDLDKLYEGVIERDLKILTYEANNYPYMLKQITNPPPVLYYRGDLSVCNLERTLAVVGSRRISRNGVDSLKKVMSGLGGTDLCIVSGLATGADTAAHRFALDNGLKTIGVIAGGMDNIYPPSNKGLINEIISGKGAILSECYPTVEPLPYRFPQRNRIVSGLSYGTLVVEAAMKSGALITANLTLEQGRELMCIPGLITNPNTAGIYKMLKTGATMVTESDDILNALNWTINKQITLFSNNERNLSDTEQSIIKSVEVEPKTFDEIKKETEIGTDELLMYLTTLELNGYIEQTVGDRYKSVK